MRGKRSLLDLNVDMFGNKSLDDKQLDLQKSKFDKQISELETDISDIANLKIYRNSFEWRFEFPEVLDENGDFVGFDVIIGNPPYFSLSKIKEFEQVFKSYQTYSKSADIYCLFYEKSLQLIRNQGFSTFITSNSWMKTQYGELLRKFFVEQTNPLVLINIEDAQVFEEATVESNILLLQKSFWEQNLTALTLDKSFNATTTIEEYLNSNKLLLNELDINGWSIGNQEEVNLKNKIEINSIFLKDSGIEIYRGVTTGLNEAFDIDEETKNRLILEDSQNIEIIKPILRGRDIGKFTSIYNNRWIIFTRRGIDISYYPAVEKYLLRYFEQLRPRNNNEPTGRKSGSYQWYEIQDNIAYFQDFEKEKIIWGELSNDAKFTFDDEGYFLNNTIFFMTGKNLKFLLSILNSKLAKWYFEKISTSSGMGTNRWLKYKVEQLPIRPLSENLQIPFISIINQILALKKEDSKADTSELEAEIDRMVYELYELTEEEILIVEGK
jgi:adenine-specific DNA-methyltransferase